jgi:Domain of Unknown Function (DUF1259)
MFTVLVLPRSDLKVTLDGVELKPALALGSWLAFQKTGGQAMVMGDLVLIDEEAGPVMNKLIEGGIDVTALHNHLLRSSPATLYMHIRGHGDPVTLATTLHNAPRAKRLSRLPHPGRLNLKPPSSISRPPRLAKFFARKARSAAAFFNSLFLAPRLSRRNGSKCHPLWARGSPSTSSRPAAEKQL